MRVRLLLVTVAIALAGCSAQEQVTGIITMVDGDLTEVRAFSVAVSGRDVLTFQPDDEIESPFPLVHLNEHRTSLIPVTVRFEDRDGVLVAVEVGDAEGDEHRFGG